MYCLIPGISTAVHRHWDLSLYHPDDLPHGLGGPPEDPQISSGGPLEDPPNGPRINGCPPPLPGATSSNQFKGVPPTMTKFRKAIAGAVTQIRGEIFPPAFVPPLPSAFVPPMLPAFLPASVSDVYKLAGALASLEHLARLAGLPSSSPPERWDQADPRSIFTLTGGEEEGLGRLALYVLGSPPNGEPPNEDPLNEDPQSLFTLVPDNPCGANTPAIQSRRVDAAPPLATYAHTRALATGLDTTSMLSPYVSTGCLTARQIYRAVAKAREAVRANMQLRAEGREAAMANKQGQIASSGMHEVHMESCDLLIMHLEV
eukprot:gene830-2221_t